MATGMASPSSFREQPPQQRRGPPRSSGRSGPSYPRSQSGGMTKRNGAGSYGPNQSHPGNAPPAPVEDPAEDDGFYTNARMVAGVTQAVGRLVRVEVANGNIYEGILMTISREFSLQLDQAKLLTKADGTMEKDVFSSLMFKRDDFISVRVPEIDIRADTFLDSAISSTGRVNGQSNDPSKVKTLVEWADDSESPGLTLEDAGTAGANGWDADEMFSTNAAKFNVESSYEDSLAIYTTPLPKFRSAEEERKMRQFAEENARQIESTDGYRQRLEAENNPTVDEETKYSSVVREGEAKPASDRYVPPARRQAPSEQGQRGPPGGPSSQQPLPQRENRRERGDARQENRWDRPLNRGPHPMAQQPPHMSAHAGPPPQAREPPSDRLNGDVRERRQEPAGRNNYQGRQPPHHNVGPGVPPQRVPPQHNPHIPPSHPHSHPHPHPHNMQQMPPPMHPAPSQLHGRGGPPPGVAVPMVVPPAMTGPSPQAVDKADGQPGPQQGVAPHLVGDKKSPREKDRQEKQVANLRQFHTNFKLSDEDKKDERGAQQTDRPQSDRRPDHEQESVPAQQDSPATGNPTPHTAPPPTMVSQGVTATSQGSSATPTPSQAQGPPPQSQGHQTSTQVAPPSESPDPSVASNLNPLAMEFKPRTQQPMQVATPTPSATPPAQALRQSPGMMPLQQQQSMLMQSYHPTYVMQPKVMPMSQQHHQQQQAKPYQPKRAVVSVDPVALATHAQNATGQPLQLAAQAATMQQQPYVYQLPPGQMQAYPFGQYVMWNTQGMDQQQMVRVVQGLPQGAGMDPNQGASNQQQHIQQQLFMPQQPVPAHMQPQAMSQPMPQPAHTMHPHTQHMSHAQHSHSLPPVSQAQSSHPHPHPSPSPVQHMGGGNPNPSGPQLNHHAQGAPPTSGTPQSMLYGQQMPGMLPPQGGGHAMPAHSVSQGPSPALHFMHNQMQVGTSQPLRLRNGQAGVSLSQAGGSGSGGPAPAHMQPSGHMNQPQHVVVMPQPPPQAINQAPLNPPHSHNQHHHQQHQHAAAAAQFQQQLQGAANQLHANVGPNQHLQLQGGVSNAGMMPHNIHFAMQQGMQGGHSHHSHHPHHSHNQPHYQAQ